MSKDYIPHAVSEFHDWQTSVTRLIAANRVGWKLPNEAVDALFVIRAEWDAFYPTYADRMNRTRVIEQRKKQLMQRYTAAMRQFMQAYVANNPLLSAGDRAAIGLRPRDRTPTRVPRPDAMPHLTVDASERLTHRIVVRNAAAMRHAKPDGVHGCELWYSIDKEPVSETELQYAGLSTDRRFVRQYDGALGGVRVWYWARWTNRRGETGPWSEPVCARIMD